MPKKPSVFLESHNIKNPYFGFGQFNFHLIQAMQQYVSDDFKIVLHAKNIGKWKETFGNTYAYKKYFSLCRYEHARIRKKYDLWHAMNQNTKIEPHSTLPYLLTIHNITYIKNPESYKDEEVHKRFQDKINRSSAITYISKYAQDSTHKFFNVPDVKEVIIYNGNPITDIAIPDQYAPQIKTDRPFLFSIGEFTARKNFKSLIHMMEHLPDYDIIIAGKNTTKEASELRELVIEKGLSKRVFLPGKVSEVDKQWYYKNCKAFVFPSLREGFGLPIIEAMRYGKPVFTSNVTSLPEIGTDIAYYWEHYDAAYMAETLQQGIQSFESEQQKNEALSVAHAQSFSWDDAARDYIHVYKELLNL